MNTIPAAVAAQGMPSELSNLIEMLGRERVVALLAKFQVILRTSLTCDLDEYAEMAVRTHKIVSQAGMLGFHSLSSAAQELEGAAQKRLGLGELHGIAVREQQRTLVEIQRIMTLLSGNGASAP